MHAAALDFLDFYADEAVGFGWSTLQLFGVHPELGDLRSDYCGALVLSGEKVSGVEPNRLLFSGRTIAATCQACRPAGFRYGP